jgi:hypothetical protein
LIRLAAVQQSALGVVGVQLLCQTTMTQADMLLFAVQAIAVVAMPDYLIT